MLLQISCNCSTAAAVGDAAASAAVAAAVGDEGGGWGVPRPTWVFLAFLQFFLKLITNLNLVNRFCFNGLNGCKPEILYILSLHLHFVHKGCAQWVNVYGIKLVQFYYKILIYITIKILFKKCKEGFN